MNVDELLDLMEETLEEGTAMPFSSGKRVVDVDKMRDIIDDVRANLPDEMRQSKKIVDDRERIMQDAHQEADSIITQRRADLFSEVYGSWEKETFTVDEDVWDEIKFDGNPVYEMPETTTAAETTAAEETTAAAEETTTAAETEAAAETSAAETEAAAETSGEAEETTAAQ